MKARIFWIDIVKFVAILFVILAHVVWIVEQGIQVNCILSNDFLTINSIIATLGVPLFMLVSGSLLLGKDFKSKSDIFAFYKGFCQEHRIEVVCPSAVCSVTGRISFIKNVGRNQVNRISINTALGNFFFGQNLFNLYHAIKWGLGVLFISQPNVPYTKLNITQKLRIFVPCNGCSMVNRQIGNVVGIGLSCMGFAAFGVK